MEMKGRVEEKLKSLGRFERPGEGEGGEKKNKI